jgi:hypothetical protein
LRLLLIGRSGGQVTGVERFTPSPLSQHATLDQVQQYLT